MKKIMIACGLAMSLAGCANLPVGVTTAVTGISNTISAVQGAAVKACQFQPTESTVEAIIGKLVPGLDTVQSIVNQICAAVSPPSVAAARRARSEPMVAGVPVRGRFVR